jgi:branched-chain amino acid transport system ATP-binding protein
VLIALEQVSARYGSVLALRDIALQVEDGELVTLIGANGAGKSTTLKTISGIMKPAGGRVLLDGQDTLAWSPRRLIEAGVVHVPEGRQVFAHMTVLENLEMGAFLLRDGRRVAQRLEFVCQHFPVLKSRLQQAAGTLSGGEQSMLAIGRGLMLQPRLLLLDEPLLGLSPVMSQEVLRIVRRLHEQGMAILLVEQNARAALRISDRGYVLETGRTVISGSAADLLADSGVRKAYLGM